MNRNLKTIIIILFGAAQSFAQQDIPNGDFESWDLVTISTQNYFEKYYKPTFWVRELGICDRILKSESAGVEVFSGEGTLLLYNKGKEIIPSVVSSTFAYTNKPDHVSFWSKTKNYNGKPFKVEVVLYDRLGDIIGQGVYMPGNEYHEINETTQDYQESILKLDYISTGMPDSASVVITSAFADDYPAESYMLIDSLHFSSYSAGAPNIRADEQENLWRVIPNPVSASYLELRFSSNIRQATKVIELMDMTGKVLLSQVVIAEEDTDLSPRIDISTLTSGMYLMSVDIGGFKSVQKVLVNH